MDEIDCFPLSKFIFSPLEGERDELCDNQPREHRYTVECLYRLYVYRRHFGSGDDT